MLLCIFTQTHSKWKVSICYRKWACKRFLYFFPQWLWQWVSFKMWPFHTHKEHIKHTLCSRKALTEVRFMCRGLDFQIETNAVSKMFVIYAANVLAWIPMWLLKNWEMKSDLNEPSHSKCALREGSPAHAHNISLRTCSVHHPGALFLPTLSYWEATLLLPLARLNVCAVMHTVIKHSSAHTKLNTLQLQRKEVGAAQT